MAQRHIGVKLLVEKKKKSDLADKFIIRMPDGLRDRIAEAAFKNGRSMNAEVVAALENAFPEIPGLEEFQNDVDFILGAYKAGSGTWSRDALRGLLSTVAHQVAYGEPPEQD